MLQRAASNAYSWWWASHIRTKQSKWLEQNLQDMEDKVQNVLKLIEEDGDSFAKRAEMYYKKRPELIVFVEESYRAYRALAERYDHISTELQNANNTIASVFPEQVQFTMEDDEDFSPRVRPPPEIMRPNIPKVPKAPIKDLKSLLASSAKKLKNNKEVKKSAAAPVPKSGLSKEEALKRIDKVQKDILALQTVKEFVKSSYESGLARHWEIEKQIKEMQEEVSNLQDEFGEGMVIEDDEARKLMAAAALRSCQETLSQLQEKQRKSTEEVLLERERTKNSWNKYKSLKEEILPGVIDGETSEIPAGIEKMSQEDGETHNMEELGSLGEKIEQHFEAEFSVTSLTATEMAEKIDELVEKVISLETAFSSQTALVKRLRAENNNLQAQIQALEDDKVKLMNVPEKIVQNKMKQMEEKLHGIHVLNQSVKDQNNNLQTHFKEANLNLEHLSGKLNCIKSDEEEEIASLPLEAAVDKAKVNPQLEDNREEQKHNLSDKLQQSPDEQKHSNLHRETEASGQSEKNSTTSSEVVLLEESGQTLPNEEHVACNQVGEGRAQVVSDASISTQGNRCHYQKTRDTGTSGICEDPQLKDEADAKNSSSLAKDDHSQVEDQGNGIEQEEPDWRELFLKGMENREKTLLMEYTTVLRNFKEMKKKLSEVERKDEEILSLRKKVSLLQMVLDERKDSKEPKASNHLQSSQAVIDQALMPNSPGDPTILLAELYKDDDMGVILVNQHEPTSETEEKLRMDIDQLLEENLEFWLRFSSTLNQIQKYETAVEDLQTEVLKLEETEKNQEGSHSRATQSSFKSEVRPIYKHLKEIHTELSVWTEKCTQLKDEQKSRFSSLCNIQEEITKALKASAEDEEFKFTSYQAAKFQGEVLNMKQENNKVADELQAGLDHLAALQAEVERILARLNEKLGLPGPKDYQGSQLKQAISRSRIPLRSFIFGVKQKKQRTSIFSSMSPIMNRRYHAMKAGYSV